MYEESGGNSTLGIISLVTGALGLFGQGCCCIPIVSIFATFIVPALILASIVTGGIGVAQGGPGRPMAMAGLALGLFDVVFMTVAYGTIFLLYGGLVVLGSM